jgi:phospholipase/carboxylesterase
MAKIQHWYERVPDNKKKSIQVGVAVASVLVVGTIAAIVYSGQARRGLPNIFLPKPDKRGGESKQGNSTKCTSGEIDGVFYEEIVTGGADPNEKLPMVIAFHGLGSTPGNVKPVISKLTSKARIILPRGFESQGKNFAWWKTRAAGDQSALTNDMAKASARFKTFLKSIVLCRPTRGLPIVAGHSQGGMMALGLAATQQGLVDEAVVGSAWLPVGLWRSDMSDAFLVHGSTDEIVPYERTRDMVKSLGAKGNNWELETIQGHGHGLSGELSRTWLEAIDQSVSG